MNKNFNINLWLSMSSFTTQEIAFLLLNENPSQVDIVSHECWNPEVHAVVKIITRAIEDGDLNATHFNCEPRIKKADLSLWIKHKEHCFPEGKQFLNGLTCNLLDESPPF